MRRRANKNARSSSGLGARKRLTLFGGLCNCPNGRLGLRSCVRFLGPWGQQSYKQMANPAGLDGSKSREPIAGQSSIRQQGSLYNRLSQKCLLISACSCCFIRPAGDTLAHPRPPALRHTFGGGALGTKTVQPLRSVQRSALERAQWTYQNPFLLRVPGQPTSWKL